MMTLLRLGVPCPPCWPPPRRRPSCASTPRRRRPLRGRAGAARCVRRPHRRHRQPGAGHRLRGQSAHEPGARGRAAQRTSACRADTEFRTMMLESLIEERAMLSHARDSGVRVDDAEIDRAVGVIAAQNQITPTQLRSAWRQDGMDLRALSRQPARPDDGRARARARGGATHPHHRRRDRRADRAAARQSRPPRCNTTSRRC